VHEKRLPIRWRDMDGYGHVNNAVFLTYLEEARDEWLLRLLGSTGGAADYVVARIAIDYRRELRQSDEEVTVRCRVDRLGTSSIQTREEIVLRDGQIAAQADVVLVMRDRAAGRSRPLTREERAALERDAGR
jgi:acyl-CoA thioester hydrolase